MIVFYGIILIIIISQIFTFKDVHARIIRPLSLLLYRLIQSARSAGGDLHAYHNFKLILGILNLVRGRDGCIIC